MRTGARPSRGARLRSRGACVWAAALWHEVVSDLSNRHEHLARHDHSPLLPPSHPVSTRLAVADLYSPAQLPLAVSVAPASRTRVHPRRRPSSFSRSSFSLISFAGVHLRQLCLNFLSSSVRLSTVLDHLTLLRSPAVVPSQVPPIISRNNHTCEMCRSRKGVSGREAGGDPLPRPFGPLNWEFRDSGGRAAA